MMMDTIGKPDLLHELLESLPLRIGLIALIVQVDGLADIANRQVKAAILVPKDIASPLSSLRKVINEFLLGQR